MRRLVFALLPLGLALACGSTNGGDASAGGGGGTDAAASASGGPATPPGADGGTAADGAAAAPFCPSLTPAPTLCADFDDGATPKSSRPQVDAGASCRVDAGAYVCEVPAGVTAVTTALLGIPVPFDAAGKRLVVSFAFRPSAAAPTTGTLVILRAFVGSAHAVAIELASESGPVLREQENPPGGLDVPSGKLASMPAAGAWTRYALTVDLVAKSAALTANGAPIASMSLGGAQYDRFALNLGLQSDAPFEASYDDVVVDVQR